MIRKKQTLRKEVEQTIKLLVVTLGVLIIGLSGTYLYLNSQSAQKGYLLEQVRLQNEKLKDISEDLKTEVTDISSSASFGANEKLEEMTETPKENMEYLLPEDNN